MKLQLARCWALEPGAMKPGRFSAGNRHGNIVVHVVDIAVLRCATNFAEQALAPLLNSETRRKGFGGNDRVHFFQLLATISWRMSGAFGSFVRSGAGGTLAFHLFDGHQRQVCSTRHPSRQRLSHGGCCAWAENILSNS